MGWTDKIRAAGIAALIGPTTQTFETRIRGALRRLSGTAGRLDVYVRADDPYSYLLAQRLPELRRRYGLALSVIPLPVPDESVEPDPDLRVRYAVRDARELSQYYELDFPSGPDAPNADLVARANALLCATDGDPVQTVLDVGRAVWSGDELSMSRLEADRPLPDAAEVEATLRGNYRQVWRRGHYQGAMIYADGLWAWGVDRLHYIESFLGGAKGEPLLRERDPDRFPVPEDLPQKHGRVQLELFFSFRSPYSYLVAEATFALADELPVDIVFRPLLPMVMRGFKVPFAKRLYFVRDCKREADRTGLPFGHICDPVGTATERCLSLVPYAVERGRVREMVTSIGTGIWSEARNPADDRDLRALLERAGLDWDGAQPHLRSDAWREMAETNRQGLTDLGLWGVPSFRLGDVSFWGQDRLWILRDKIRRFAEVAKRNGRAAATDS